MNTSNVLKIGISGAVGGILCVLADLAQKEEASAVLKIGCNLESLLKIPYANISTVFIVIGIAVALCFIFDVQEKKRAFYLGASVLAIMMTLVPYKAPPSLETVGNSVKVNMTLQTDDGRPVSEAVLTLYDENNRVIARSKFQSGRFYFYQSDGHYRMCITVPGYRMIDRHLDLNEKERPQISITIDLKHTSIPISIQRFLKK